MWKSGRDMGKYPVLYMTQEQRQFMDKNKKKLGIGQIFLVLGAIICVCGMLI